MITSVKAGLIPLPPNTKANANDIPVIPMSSHPNFRGSNKKKNKRQPWKRDTSCICCHCTPQKGMLQGSSMYRRQVLLASTSLPLKPQQMLEAIPPPPNLTDYQKLANAVQKAEKLKHTSHGSQDINDVVWLSSADSLKHNSSSKSPDELSGIIAIPPAQDSLRRGIHENEVVTARVKRRGAINLRSRDKEEQVVLEGIEVTNDKPLCFDVYIKLGDEEDDDDEDLYAGTFSHMPPPRRKQQLGRHNNTPDSNGNHQQQKTARRCCLRLGMNDMAIHRPLKAHQEESVIVKLVPTFKLDQDPIKIDSIFLE